MPYGKNKKISFLKLLNLLIVYFINAFDEPYGQLFVQKYAVSIHNFTRNTTRGTNYHKTHLIASKQAMRKDKIIMFSKHE